MYLERLTADAIDRWAATGPARTDLQELVLRLILHTLPAAAVSIRTGLAVGSQGWDGIVETLAERDPIPAGRSLWEMSTGKEVQDKAQENYRERTDKMPPEEAAMANFVFVTPRHWDRERRKDWLGRKSEEKVWGSVLVLDAGDLFTWLLKCMPAHIWLSEKIFGRSTGLETLKDWWAWWSGGLPGVSISPAVTIVSRDAQVASVRSWHETSADFHSIRSTAGMDEVLAFIYGALASDPATESALTRAIIVRDRQAWDELVAYEDVPLVLVPLFDNPDITAANRHGHAVIQPIAHSRVGYVDLDLPPRKSSELQRLLETEGIDETRARRLSKEARDDLQVLQRGLGGRAWKVPAWANSGAARFVVPALFARRWDQAQAGDKDVLARLADLDYGTLEREWGALIPVDESPLRRRAQAWELRSPTDSWLHLQSLVTSGDWDNFRSVAIDVVGAPDPARELPADERWMANIKGKVRAHSAGLRRGLAETLAMVGARPEFETLTGGARGPDLAAHVVRTLLEAANAAPDGDGWSAIRGELPLLAEAAPRVFLDALQVGTAGAEPILRPLFDEQPGFLFAQSDHSHLLWALERIAWSPELLSAVTLVVGKLASIDPGGSHGPRPMDTLHEIFFVTHPQTGAVHEQRMQALALLRREMPEIAWPLLVRLVPSRDQIIALRQKPEWQTWGSATQNDGRADPNALDAAQQIIAWLLGDAGTNGSRWSELVTIASERLLPSGTREPVLAALEALDPAEFDDEQREPLAKALRETVGRHTAFADTDWAMDPAWVARIEPVAARFEPDDLVIRHRWIFEDWPPVERVRGENYEVRQARVDDERREALEELLKADGCAGVDRLVNLAASPTQVGRSLATLSEPSIEGWSLSLATESDSRRLLVFDGYAHAKGWVQGWDWTESVARAHRGDWPANIIARFLLTANDIRRSWLLASELGSDVELAYWTAFDRYPTGDQMWEAVEKLLEFGRPLHAIDLAGPTAAAKDARFRPDVAIAVLDAGVKSEEGDESIRRGGNLQWDIAQIFKGLDQAGTDELTMIRLEWAYLTALEHTDYSPDHLQRALVSDPETFVAMINLAFITEAQGEAKRAGEAPPEHTPQEAAMARQALRLLMTLRRSPGVLDDGSMDTEALKAWAAETRRRLVDSDRLGIGDEHIGKALWHSPPGADGVHPHEVVRDLIQDLANDDIERGFQVQAFNSRGVHVRRGDGGEEERELAAEFDAKADALAGSWPRASNALRGIADDYRRWAERWDRDLEDD